MNESKRRRLLEHATPEMTEEMFKAGRDAMGAHLRERKGKSTPEENFRAAFRAMWAAQPKGWQVYLAAEARTTQDMREGLCKLFEGVDVTESVPVVTEYIAIALCMMANDEADVTRGIDAVMGDMKDAADAHWERARAIRSAQQPDRAEETSVQ